MGMSFYSEFWINLNQAGTSQVVSWMCGPRGENLRGGQYCPSVCVARVLEDSIKVAYNILRSAYQILRLMIQLWLGKCHTHSASKYS